MLRDKPQLHVVFVPWGTGHVDQHVAVGAAWLLTQAGRPAVFVPLKGNYERNGTLPRLLPHVQVLTERNRHREHWSGGPLLVCWPTEKMLGILADEFAGRLTIAARTSSVARGGPRPPAWVMTSCCCRRRISSSGSRTSFRWPTPVFSP